jgi:glucoamylase
MQAPIDALPADAPLNVWITGQKRKSAEELFAVISATTLSKPRFGVSIVPRRGSVLGSRTLASYDPDPDYFFHWLRDSALVMNAVRLLGQERAWRMQARRAFRDFVRFSLGLAKVRGADLDYARLVKQASPTEARFLRPARELREILDDRIPGEVRFNPDGSLDLLRWSRPQNDGPALRAITNLRYWRAALETDAKELARLRELIAMDLDYVCRCWRDASYDIWEEELGFHYYTQLVQLTALEEGAIWASSATTAAASRRYASAGGRLRRRLNLFWSQEHGAYVSRRGPETTAGKAIDASVLLAVINAGLRRGPHSIVDPRVHATLATIEDVFWTALPLNKGLADDLGPGIGRYRGDIYYGGGVFLIATLAVAELYYRLAAAAARARLPRATIGPLLRRLSQGSSEGLAARLFDRGDAYMRTIRRFAPRSGELPEQFDRTTGAPTSCKNLPWSHAAIVTAVASRDDAIESMRTTIGSAKPDGVGDEVPTPR